MFGFGSYFLQLLSFLGCVIGECWEGIHCVAVASCVHYLASLFVSSCVTFVTRIAFNRGGNQVLVILVVYFYYLWNFEDILLFDFYLPSGTCDDIFLSVQMEIERGDFRHWDYAKVSQGFLNSQVCNFGMNIGEYNFFRLGFLWCYDKLVFSDEYTGFW